MNCQLKERPVCRLAGDTGLIVEFGEGIDPDINKKVRAMAAAVKTRKPDGIIEIIPTYRSLLFIYNPVQIQPKQLITLIEEFESTIDTVGEQDVNLIEIPVCYGKDFSPDIENVKASSNLDSDEVIRLHSQPEYLIYMVGFTPGFPFLGGLDEKLFTPRLTTPRLVVPAGSVGIANNQTGMYPIDSPGGWQIIGRTPLKLFAPQRKKPFLYKAGDKIKFIPISQDEFEQIKKEENM
ncbi:MAG: 5-oxoprolinase subunit PxpB [Desulfobacteraceae bacterium]|nr:5-oxoprolinase subunit PxpB [Desulfobacteraceae bacterium]